MRRLPHAFSLLELILVLVILGIATAVVAVRLSPMRTTQGVVQAGRALTDQMIRGRRLALSRGALARLRLDLDAQTASMQVQTAKGYADPPDAELPDCALRLDTGGTQTISFTGADAKTQKTGQVDFLFSPDARCNPSGSVTIQNGASNTVVVCPPTTRPAYVGAAP